MITIAVRNMGGAFYAQNRFRSQAKQAAGLDAVLATSPDILILQEATGVGKPFGLPTGWRSNPKGLLDRGSGSVVAARDHIRVDLDWRPRHPVLDACDAYLDFGLLQELDHEIVLASVHAPTSDRPEIWAASGRQKPQGDGRPWISDLILDALLDALKGRDVILAGDWNEAPNYPNDNDPGSTEWFDRARRNGLVEIVSTTFGGPVRTNFTPQSRRSYQNDHVFMSTAPAELVQSVSVFNEPPMRALSDHAGLVVKLGTTTAVANGE